MKEPLIDAESKTLRRQRATFLVGFVAVSAETATDKMAKRRSSNGASRNSAAAGGSSGSGH